MLREIFKAHTKVWKRVGAWQGSPGLQAPLAAAWAKLKISFYACALTVIFLCADIYNTAVMAVCVYMCVDIRRGIGIVNNWE